MSTPRVLTVPGGGAAETDRIATTLLGSQELRSAVEVKSAVTPDGGGSPAGLHTHEFDQLFYIVDGAMELEIDGWRGSARAGDIVVFPAGVPHRNWNAGPSASRHLVFNVKVVS